MNLWVWWRFVHGAKGSGWHTRNYRREALMQLTQHGGPEVCWSQGRYDPQRPDACSADVAFDYSPVVSLYTLPFGTSPFIPFPFGCELWSQSLNASSFPLRVSDACEPSSASRPQPSSSQCELQFRTGDRPDLRRPACPHSSPNRHKLGDLSWDGLYERNIPSVMETPYSRLSRPFSLLCFPALKLLSNLMSCKYGMVRSHLL